MKILNFKKIKQKTRRGGMMLELALVSIIALIGIPYLIGQYESQKSESEYEEGVQEIQSIAGKIREFYQTYGTYNPTVSGAMELNTQNGVIAKFFPNNTISDYTGGTAPRDPWGGRYQIGPSSDGVYFGVSADEVPSDACLKLIIQNGNGGGNGLLGSTVSTSTGTTSSSTATVSDPTGAATTYDQCQDTTGNSSFLVTMIYK